MTTERKVTRCSECGKTPKEAWSLPGKAPPTSDGAPCQYGQGGRHLWVSEGHPRFREGPLTQYAAEVFELVSACPECLQLVRHGRTPAGKDGVFDPVTLRKHEVTCHT